MLLCLSSTSSCITKNWLQEPFSSSPPPPTPSVFCPNALPASINLFVLLAGGRLLRRSRSYLSPCPCSATSSTIDRSINLTRVSIKDTKLNKLTGNGARLLSFFIILLYIFFSGVHIACCFVVAVSFSISVQLTASGWTQHVVVAPT